MPKLAISLDITASPLAILYGTTAIYIVGGKLPGLITDFSQEFYFKNSVDTFSNTVTHSRAGNATMVDSDGLLKWAPHNLALNSATPATQSITVVSGAEYTVECTGVSIALSGAGTGTVTEGSPVTITASTTTLTLTVTGSTGTMWAYRSDLGGMVNNPDRGDSYVPTTSSAVYLPRRGHHVYNGDTWVNKGLLHESEARTNLALYSNDFSNAAWTKSGATVSQSVVGPDGATSGWTHTSTSTSARSEQTFTVATSTPYVYSVYAKAGTADFLYLSPVLFTTPSNASGVWFDLSNGTVGTQQNTTQVVGLIEDAGDGWYRCIIHILSTDAADTSGTIRNNVVSSNGVTTCSVGDSISLYGAQLEAGSTPSSYMPTNGSQYTRAAETLTVPAANLPWPSPVVIGEELVTNGTFDTDTTGWTAGSAATLSQVDGRLRISEPTSTGTAFQSFPTEIGKVYRVEATASNPVGTSPTPAVWIGSSGSTNNVAAFNTSVNYVGEISGNFVATGTTTFVTVLHIGAEGYDFDNISVKEINPLSVSIQMQGEMTYANENQVFQIDFFRWLKDGSNFIENNVTTASTASGRMDFRQEAAGVNDFVSSGNNYYSPGVNVPFNIASRHGSTFINGAVDGTALTANTTPVALPDLSATDLQLGYDFNGTISLFRIWANDIGDAGIAEAST